MVKYNYSGCLKLRKSNLETCNQRAKTKATGTIGLLLSLLPRSTPNKSGIEFESVSPFLYMLPIAIQKAWMGICTNRSIMAKLIFGHFKRKQTSVFPGTSRNFTDQNSHLDQLQWCIYTSRSDMPVHRTDFFEKSRSNKFLIKTLGRRHGYRQRAENVNDEQRTDSDNMVKTHNLVIFLKSPCSDPLPVES